MNKLQEWCQNNNMSDVLLEWDFEKNDLNQDEVSPRSTKKAWWKCKNGHSYEAPINDKIRKRYEADCFQCKYDMWDNERNQCRKETILTNPGTYWWKCANKSHAPFLACTHDIVCPSCERNKKIDEYEKEYHGIYERFLLNPFEEYLYSQLKHFDLSNFDPENKYFNISNIRKNGKGDRGHIKHFGVNLADTGYLRISKDNYIDFSIYDDICCRELPFDSKIKAKNYNSIIYDLLKEKVDLEQADGVVDVANDFKKELFLYSLEHTWYAKSFFSYNYFIYEEDRIELMKKAINKLDDYKERSDNEIIDTINQNKVIENGHILELCLNETEWNKNQSLYNSIKKDILSAKTLEDKIRVGEQIVNNLTIQKLLNIFFLNSKTGVDFVLGNYSKENIETRIKYAYENYDYNMGLMSKENEKEFNAFLEQFVLDLEMEEIYSLKDCKYSGIYLLVFDDYKRVYIGQAENICKRIKQHWSHSTAKPLGRLIFGGAESVISVDCFGPLDTTRIFVKYLDKNALNRYEQKMISEYERHYLLNRIGGGGVVGVLNSISML